MSIKSKTIRKIIIISVASLLVISIVVGLLFYFKIIKIGTSPVVAQKTETAQDLADLYNSASSSGNYSEVVKTLAAQPSLGSDPSLQLMYANALQGNGETQKAVDVLLEASKGKPNEYWYKGHIGDILRSAGNKDGALAYYKEAIDLASKYKSSSDEEAYSVQNSVSDYNWYIGQIESGK
jgi:tetratricopeptide (TPR) repeat protein